MKILHRAVKSSIFELAKTVELDIHFNDEDAFTTRIELFRDTEQPNRFRCHVWERELFRLTPSFPRNDANVPAHVTDDHIMVERGIPHSEIASILNETFEAPSVEAALNMVIEDLKKFLEHATGEKAG
jgi:hypothetical protein